MRSKPLAHSPPGVTTFSIPPLAMIVESASFVFKEAGSIKQEEGSREHFGVGRYIVLYVITPVERRSERGMGERSGFHTCDPM